MSALQQRKTLRAVHLVLGVTIILFAYGPHVAVMQDVIRVVVLPALVLTGIAMWQMPRLRRLLCGSSLPAAGPTRAGAVLPAETVVA